MTGANPTLETFTPDDLRAAVILIDYACEQGAFKGWEDVNKAYVIRNRILAFVEQWSAISPTNTEDMDNSVSNTQEEGDQ